MSLVFYLIHPRSYASPLGGQVDVGNASVRLDSVELAAAAALGEAASSTTEIDDPQGIYTPTALWFFRMDENSYASNTMLYVGIIGDRTARRDKERALLTGAARLWTLDLAELDAAMSFRMVTDASADRPAETADARLAWVLADSYAPFHDHGLVTYPTNAMDAADYRGRTFRDVLADLALVSGYNFWTDVRQSDGQVSLFFFDANTSTDYGSPLRISNTVSDVTGDATGWTYYPSTDGELRRSGARVASGVYLPYSGGNVYTDSAAIASNFGFRDLPAPMATVSSSAKATTLANRFLSESSTEDDTVIVTVRLPIAAVKMVRKGHRMQARFQHLDGWEDWTWARIKRLTIIQDEGTVETLRLRLELTPQNIPVNNDYTGDVFAGMVRSDNYSSQPKFQDAQSSPPAGWDTQAVTGPIAMDQAVAPFSSVTVSQPMIARLHARVWWSGVPAAGTSLTVELLVNGNVVGTNTQEAPGGYWATSFEIDLREYRLAASDTVAIRGTVIAGWTNFGTNGNGSFLRVGRGTFVWDTETWTGP